MKKSFERERRARNDEREEELKDTMLFVSLIIMGFICLLGVLINEVAA